MIPFLRRQAFLRGLMGGSRGWTAFWMLFAAMGLARRLTRDRPEVVYCEELRPGDALLISGEARLLAPPQTRP